MAAGTATKTTAPRATTPKRIPTARKPAARETAVPTSTPTATEVDLERFFPGFEKLVGQGINVALPQVLKLFRGGPEAGQEEREAAAARDLAAIFGMLKPVMDEVVPVLVDQVWQFTQDRSRDGAEPTPGSEELERFFPALIGALAPTLIGALPGAIQGLSGLFGGSRTMEDQVVPVVDDEVLTRFWGPLISVVAPVVKKVLPDLISVVTGTRARDVGISWADFVETNRLHDGDNVALIGNDPIDDPAMTEIVLELAPHKTWWKGIQVQDGGGALVTEIGVQDDDKARSVRVPSQVLVDPGGYLVFMKAKAFGVHTGMYRLNCGGLADELRGRRAHFYWYAD